MRNRRAVLAGAAVAVVAAAGLLLSHGLGARSGWAGPGAQGRITGFARLRPQPAPAGWLRAVLPGHTAVLSYPRWLQPEAGDAGTVTVALASRTGRVLAYLNVTPQQGDEGLRNWAGFRLGHLREDGDTAVRLDARSADVGFRGGRGRCVIDDYVTRIRGNHYREIACFVQAGGGGSVLVAAAPTAEWGSYGGVLQRAVTAYQAG